MRVYPGWARNFPHGSPQTWLTSAQLLVHYSQNATFSGVVEIEQYASFLKTKICALSGLRNQARSLKITNIQQVVVNGAHFLRIFESAPRNAFLCISVYNIPVEPDSLSCVHNSMFFVRQCRCEMKFSTGFKSKMERSTE